MTIDLRPFANWLLNVEAKELSTASRYVSAVGPLLRAGGAIDLHPVSVDIEAVKARNEARSMSWQDIGHQAWEAYRRWRRQEDSVEVPGLRPDPAPVPPGVQNVVAVLVRTIGVRRVVRLRWRHVQGGHVLDPLNEDSEMGYSLRRPTLLVPLRNWAQPPDENAPVVPVEPGSATPRTVKQLQALAKPQAAVPPRQTRRRPPRDRKHRPPPTVADPDAVPLDLGPPTGPQQSATDLIRQSGREPTPEEAALFSDGEVGDA